MTSWVVDKSALVRLAHSPDAELWGERIERGLVRMATVTRLEVGFSTRSAATLHETLYSALVTAIGTEYLTPAIEDRAVEVQRHLVRRGQHRAPSIPDLLIAATAELTGQVVLHLDQDFELIAEITGQQVERLSLS